MNDLIKKIMSAHIIWVIGNGGSAATAEHFVTDLIKKGYPAVCLNSNTSVITMIANDYGYDEIFSKQLNALGDDLDLLITISCSGTSKNIIRAIEASGKMDKYQFETFDLEKLSISGLTPNYGELENKHLQFAHAVAAAL